MTYNAQTNESWASQLLGYNTVQPFTIGNYGCVVTSYGNLLIATTGNEEYTPPVINTYMKDHKGFLPGGGTFVWSRAADLGGVTAKGIATKSQMLSFLTAPPNFAIMGVKNDTHYVLANTTSTIVDSEDGQVKNINTYPFSSAHLFTAINLPPSANPPPLPTSGVVATTAILNLRTGPGTNFPLGTGKDDSGNTIHSLPEGVSVQYVYVSQADPNSFIQGPWLVSDRGNYFCAKYTTYGR